VIEEQTSPGLAAYLMIALMVAVPPYACVRRTELSTESPMGILRSEGCIAWLTAGTECVKNDVCGEGGDGLTRQNVQEGAVQVHGAQLPLTPQEHDTTTYTRARDAGDGGIHSNLRYLLLRVPSRRFCCQDTPILVANLYPLIGIHPPSIDSPFPQLQEYCEFPHTSDAENGLMLRRMWGDANNPGAWL